MRPTTCVRASKLTRFASQITELLLRNRESVIYAQLFRAPCKKSYALDRKMIDTFLMVSTSSIIVQRLGEIEQPAPAVDAKIWCLYIFVCLPARYVPVFKFTHRSKISIFVPQGWLVGPIHVKFGITEGETWVRLAVKNFTLIDARGWKHSPQNCKNFHFLMKSRPAGRTLWQFSIIRGFYTPN